ncbi:flagellar hook protein FlgE [Defluviitalea phaphyphila]|uniref:flagellar hook protein FlgE n=1 Tax=Defluviitalea phaphyphila TaxID=1473580 RepID=UPI000730336C|nr:flagellar hook protein FlgE [Defluviitalea phaphyphila]
MMRSMFSGVSGLRVHQTKMDVIGNNIANVNTTAFKSGRVTFNEVFSQTLQGASGPSEYTGRGGINPMQVGLGVNVSSIDTLMTSGAAQRTDNPFDLMIEGDGFFVVGDESGTYFTRAGIFRKDDSGNLVIPNGMKVYGWDTVETDEDTGVQTVVRGNVAPLKLDTPENLVAEPEATTRINIQGNLNLVDGEEGITIQVQFYDTLGNLFSGNLQATYDASSGEWTIQAIDEDGNAGSDMYIVSSDGEIETTITGLSDLNITFDSSGNPVYPSGVDELIFQIPEGDLQNSSGTTISKIGPIEISFDDITQYNSTTSIDPIRVDGREVGTLQGYSIGSDGIITASYSNGDTKVLGQIVVANFINPAGLEKVGDNLYATTPNSGDFDGIGEEGTLQGGVLEMSNVDLSYEFTEMITTQRGFQANSRIITVSDEMLQELVNLKR